MKKFTKLPCSSGRPITASRRDRTSKEKALDTLYAIKDLYEQDDSGILVAGFYHEFMKLIDEQIADVEENYK